MNKLFTAVRQARDSLAFLSQVLRTPRTRFPKLLARIAKGRYTI
jgi:hypothetical protein